MANGSPALNLMVQYIRPESADPEKGFAGYIDYEDRTDAQNQNPAEDIFFRKYEGYINYMGNEEKTTFLFDKYTDSVTETGRELYKSKFNEAQKNKSVMWELVYSFDNEDLSKAGLYDPETHYLDEKKIKTYARKSIAAILDKEDMKDSAIWAAAIHYNTDNIHIHVSIVEPNPTHTKKPYIHRDTIKAAKSVMANDLFETNKERNSEINAKIRDILVQGIKDDLAGKVSSDNRFYAEAFRRLKDTLPSDRKLWKYNNTVMTESRPIIDSITEYYIKEEKSEEYGELIKLLKEQELSYKAIYGQSSSNEFIDNRLNDLKSRMGNAVLNVIRKENIIQINQSAVEQKKIIHIPHYKHTPYKETPTYNYSYNKARRSFNQAIIELKRSLSDELESYKNQAAYAELERQLDGGRSY